MPRPISKKIVQVHTECTCGYNEVYEDYFHLRYKDFSAAKVRRKIDKSTGRPFLLWHNKLESCERCAIYDNPQTIINMPRRAKRFKTTKQARQAVHSFYEAVLSPEFQMFNGEHYLDKSDGTYKVLSAKLYRFDQPTADLLQKAFTHWIKTYWGEAFEAINPTKE